MRKTQSCREKSHGERMSIHICPRCQQRYSTSTQCNDYIHTCHSGQAALDQEDVKVIGDWTDYTGNGKAMKWQVALAGVGNELAGTDGGVRGARFTGVTARGQHAQTTRQRQHEEYIELRRTS